MEQAFLGVDVGGTGVKAGVFDSRGRALGFGHGVYSPSLNVDGRVEIPIGEIRAATRGAVRAAVRKSGAKIAAVAVASQGQTFVTLDRNDNPLHPAVIWYDSRAISQAAAMAKAIEADSSAGRRADVSPISTAPKILWFREHCPELMAGAARYLLLPDYFSYLLTGEAVTDPNTAGSTGLCDPGSGAYWPPALKAAGVDVSQVARIVRTGEKAGLLTEKGAGEWGLEPGTAYVSGTNDQYAGALSAGNCREGIFTETTGTCLAIVTLRAGLPSPMPRGILGGNYPISRFKFALVYSKTAGVVLDWFRKEFFPGLDYPALCAAAAASPAGCRGVTLLPHFDGTVSPVPNRAARGAFCNLTLANTRGDMCRAVFESLSFSFRENAELLEANGFAAGSIRSIGGGAKSDFWLQMKADVTGRPIERPAVTEAAVLGAAMLAAAGCGAYQSIEDASRSLYACGAVFKPDPALKPAYDDAFSRYLDFKSRIYREG